MILENTAESSVLPGSIFTRTCQSKEAIEWQFVGVIVTCRRLRYFALFPCIFFNKFLCFLILQYDKMTARSTYWYDKEAGLYKGTVHIDPVTHRNVGFYYCVKRFKGPKDIVVGMANRWEQVCKPIFFCRDVNFDGSCENIRFSSPLGV